MSTTVVIIVASVIATILLSFLIGSLLYKRKLQKNEENAGAKAKLIIKEAEIAAETLKKDRILEAKEKFLKMKSDFEEESSKKKNLIINNELKIKQREQTLNKELRT